MKKLVLTLILPILLFQVPPAAAMDDAAGAETFLKGQIDRVIQTLTVDGVSEETKKSLVSDIASSFFDFPLMAKLTLGRQHWSALSEAERKKFTDLFVERLKSSYLDKMMHYTKETILYSAPITAGKKVHIPTTLISDDKKISMLYKLYKSDRNWKLYDMEIQDVSLVQSFRSQFSEILAKGTIKDLFDRMERPQ